VQVVTQQQGEDEGEEGVEDTAERSSSSKYDADTAASESEDSVSTSSENDDGDDENSSVEGGCPSSNNNSRGSCAADPQNPVFPASMYVGDVLLASSSTPAMMRGKANKIGRAMHEGDDEGRPSAKRVKRPPPPQPADEEDDEQELHGRRLNNSSRQNQSSQDACDDEDDCEYGSDEAVDNNNGDDTEEEYDDEEDRGSGSETHTPSQNAHRRSQSQVAPATTRSRHSARISTNLQRASANGGATDRGAAGAGNAASLQQQQQQQPEPRRPSRPPRVRISKCWLCTFANSKMAKQVSSFVSANAGCMDPTIMADQIKREVTREVGVHVFDVSGSKTQTVVMCLCTYILLEVEIRQFNAPSFPTTFVFKNRCFGDSRQKLRSITFSRQNQI
jgi:hypothetical protein